MQFVASHEEYDNTGFGIELSQQTDLAEANKT